MHRALLAGHKATKTKERLLQSYFRPNMEKDIAWHVQGCQHCQGGRKDVHPKQNLLTPVPQCTSFNQRVQMDLFGPLKISSQGKKFVLCLTDAFTKYTVMLAIDNKEAPTVGKAIFENWVCKFGTPSNLFPITAKNFATNLQRNCMHYFKLNIQQQPPTGRSAIVRQR